MRFQVPVGTEDEQVGAGFNPFLVERERGGDERSRVSRTPITLIFQGCRLSAEGAYLMMSKSSRSTRRYPAAVELFSHYIVALRCF